MIVYHGSIEPVEHPDVDHSFRNLDFGRGFYVTTVQSQAERWAKRKANLKDVVTGTVSEYELSLDSDALQVLDFGDDMNAWIDFVCKCRDGDDLYQQYDIIIGKVANDKVYRVVDMYRRGIWEKECALKEMRVYEAYDQIAFISQEAIDQCISFTNSYEVSTDD